MKCIGNVEASSEKEAFDKAKENIRIKDAEITKVKVYPFCLKEDYPKHHSKLYRVYFKEVNK